MARENRGISTRLPFSWIAPLLLVALSAATSIAQTVSNPRLVEFYPSADHYAYLPDGRTAVTNYVFEVYLQGASSPFTTSDMGKPNPQADGLIRHDFSSTVSSWPVSGGVYESRVAAVGPNGTSRSSASNPFTFSSGTNCTFSVSPTSVSITSGGGSWVIGVSTGSGCAWTAASGANWISVSTSTGSGTGNVTITVGANTATTSRTGTVTIAGQAVTVTQAPAACAYSVSPTGLTPGSSGGSFAVSVGNTSGCSWTAGSGASWITASPTSGSGNGSVTLTVAANTTTSSRTGTVTVAGQAVTVTQSGVTSCSYTVSPPSTSFASGGGNASVNVSAGSGCSWTASSSASWVSVSPTGGSGNGIVTLTAAANTSTTSRTGTVTIAGQGVTVAQAAGSGSGGGSGTGDGLRGDYFDNMDLTAQIGTRVDATVDFDWGTGAPMAGMAPDTFSVRWMGQVQAQFSETYTFYTMSDDGVRLWVNGQLLVDNWTDHAPIENSGRIALTAGQSYTIKLEFYENGIGAVSRLLWSSPSTAKAVIPRSQLYSSTSSSGGGGGGGGTTGTGDGLRGEYFDNWDFTSPVSTRVDAAVDFDWGTSAPVAGMGADTFSVRWTGKVQAQFSEVYTFYTVSDDGVRLWVNGQLLVDNWTSHSPAEDSGSMTLTAGQSYDIKLEFFENSLGAVARLLWSSPSTAKAAIPRSQLYSAAASTGGGGGTTGAGDGLRGEYYDNWDFTAPVSTRVDATVDFDWGAGAPQAGMGADTFSVRWTGTVQAPKSEVYTFYTASDDGVRLWVNGQLLVDNWTNHAPVENSGSIALTAGQAYSIKLEFFENGGGAVARLLWSSPSTAKAVIPRSQLYSAAATTGGGGGTTGTGDGLRADYYDNWDFTALVTTRVDTTVDFDWGTGAPQSGMGADTFSVRWTGRVQAPTSETYTFYTVSDDGVRLWVNGQLVIDNWTNHAPVEDSGTITLTGGQTYSVKLEFFENGVGAVARLLWSSPSTTKSVIPTGRLFSTP